MAECSLSVLRDSLDLWGARRLISQLMESAVPQAVMGIGCVLLMVVFSVSEMRFILDRESVTNLVRGSLSGNLSSITLSATSYRWLKVAARQAMNSTCDNRHGAALVIGGRLISLGWNKPRHDYRFHDTACSIHAEIDCLRNVTKPARGIIYVVRLGIDDTWRISKPCGNCYEALSLAGVRKAVWSDDYGFGEMALG